MYLQNQTVTSFLLYFQSKRYYRLKLMVVGYGGRGKTTLLKTLMGRNRKSRKLKLKENRPTVGVDVREWK